jgi:hypothetical protein
VSPYPPALLRATKTLKRRPTPDDFPADEQFVIWAELKGCIREVWRHRLALVVRAKLLEELQDFYVDFSISLGANEVYSLTGFAETFEG